MKSLTLAACFLLILIAGAPGCSSAPAKTSEELAQASAAELRETLKATVKDAGRLQQMLTLADQAAADMQAGAVAIAKLRKEQGRLNANYNATKDEFRQLGDLMQSARKEYRSRLISARQALAQLATDDEWKKITSRDLAILGN